MKEQTFNSTIFVLFYHYLTNEPSKSIWSSVYKIDLKVGLFLGSVCQQSCMRLDRTWGQPEGIGSLCSRSTTKNAIWNSKLKNCKTIKFPFYRV